MKIFVGGSKMISCINDNVKTKLKEYMQTGAQILIGDCWGVDKAVQEFLYNNNYKNVIVYVSGNKVRNNAGDFFVRKIDAKGKNGFEFYRQKDIAMANDAHCGYMIWDGKSKGTLKNIKDLIIRGKYVEIEMM